MCSKLPHNGFTWLTKTEVENFKPLEYEDNSDTGYVLEVNM